MAGKLVDYDEDSPSEAGNRRNPGPLKDDHRRFKHDGIRTDDRETGHYDCKPQTSGGRGRPDFIERNETHRRNGPSGGSFPDQGSRRRNEEKDMFKPPAHDRSEDRSFRGGSRSHGYNSKDFPQTRDRSRSRDRGHGNYSDPPQRRNSPRTNDERYADHRRGAFRRDDRNREHGTRRRETFSNCGNAEDGSTLPTHMAPKSANVSRLMQQQEKRKLLWSSSKTKTGDVVEGKDPKAAMWQGVAFAGDSDGTVANKFKKLMGLKTGESSAKSESGEPVSTVVTPGPEEPPILRQQEEIFRNLDRQYQMARLSAHTQRGVGLGFNSR